jgi:hypothetical protein
MVHLLRAECEAAIHVGDEPDVPTVRAGDGREAELSCEPSPEGCGLADGSGARHRGDQPQGKSGRVNKLVACVHRNPPQPVRACDGEES